MELKELLTYRDEITICDLSTMTLVIAPDDFLDMISDVPIIHYRLPSMDRNKMLDCIESAICSSYYTFKRAQVDHENFGFKNYIVVTYEMDNPIKGMPPMSDKTLTELVASLPAFTMRRLKWTEYIIHIQQMVDSMPQVKIESTLDWTTRFTRELCREVNNSDGLWAKVVSFHKDDLRHYKFARIFTYKVL